MKGILIGLLACLLLAGTVLGCVKTPAADPTAETVPAPTAQPLNETTSEPTAEATAEPTPEPEPIDPFDAIDAAEIADSKHDWEDEYTARFNTHVLDTALITVHLEDNREYSDETLRTFAKTLAADVLRLGEYTGVTPRKITVYIAKRMLQNRPVLVGDHLFCTMDDMETGAYREALIGACFDLPLAWKQIGLSTVVFGNPDESGLADYYGNKAHANVASCAAVFYIPTVSDAETIAAARKTAASMTAFILETDGFDAFRSIADTAEILPAWAAHLGIEPPALIAGSAYAASMTAESDSRYLVTMQIGTDTFAWSHFADGADRLQADGFYGRAVLFGSLQRGFGYFAPAYFENASFAKPHLLRVTIMRGDANLDGKLTAADAALVLRTVVGLSYMNEPMCAAGDADGDGKITAADAAKILRLVIQLDY